MLIKTVFLHKIKIVGFYRTNENGYSSAYSQFMDRFGENNQYSRRKAMYNEPIDSVFKEANEEFEKISGKKMSLSNRLLFNSNSFCPWCGNNYKCHLLAFILYEVKNKSGPIGPIERAQRYILFLAPWFITFIFWLYPLLFSVVLSFCEYDVFHPAVFSFSGFKIICLG